MIRFRRNNHNNPTWQEAEPIYKRGLGVELERTCKLIHLVVIEGPGTSRLRIETFRIASPTRSLLVSHAGVFTEARFSSLPTNICSTEDYIPFSSLANHIVLSKFWKVDLDRKVI